MDKLIPLNSYDNFSYLSSGGAMLSIVDIFWLNGVFVKHSDWTIFQVGMVLGASYILGHFVAGVSSVIVEKILLEYFLGPPDKVYFPYFHRNYRPWGKCILIFNGYYKIEHHIEEKIEALIELKGFKNGKEVLHLARKKADENQILSQRMEVFQNLHGFLRNFVVLGVLLCFIPILLGVPSVLNIVGIYCNWQIEGIGLCLFLFSLMRYLKFVRHYNMAALKNLVGSE